MLCSAFVTHFDPSRCVLGLSICVCALLLGTQLESLYDGILAYLERAEYLESDAWMRDDIRMAWMIVRLLQQCVLGNPYVLACYAVTGVHPDNLQEKIDATRRAKLGVFYREFFPAPIQRKPVVSVRINLLKKEAA